MITTVSDNERAQAATIEQLRIQVTSLEITVESLTAEIESYLDSNLQKILAMSDEQVTALTRLDGSNPDDVAALARKAMQCAVLTVERDELRADLDAERDAAELKSACITGMRQEITAWSITTGNLEAERDALKARIETDMKSWYKLHYLMKKHGWHPGRTDHDLLDILEEKLDTLRTERAALKKSVIQMTNYWLYERGQGGCEPDGSQIVWADALAADAALWRDYQARKASLKAAGFGKSPLRSEAPDTYAVINKEGDVEYSASWPEACHDHIKEMQDAVGLGHVVGWKVRGIKILPTYKDVAKKEANHAI